MRFLSLLKRLTIILSIAFAFLPWLVRKQLEELSGVHVWARLALNLILVPWGFVAILLTLIYFELLNRIAYVALKIFISLFIALSYSLQPRTIEDAALILVLSATFAPIGAFCWTHAAEEYSSAEGAPPAEGV